MENASRYGLPWSLHTCQDGVHYSGGNGYEAHDRIMPNRDNLQFNVGSVGVPKVKVLAEVNALINVKKNVHYI